MNKFKASSGLKSKVLYFSIFASLKVGKCSFYAPRSTRRETISRIPQGLDNRIVDSHGEGWVGAQSMEPDKDKATMKMRFEGLIVLYLKQTRQHSVPHRQ